MTNVKYPDLVLEGDTEEDYLRLEKYRDDYLAGKQELDQNGNRIWCCLTRTEYEPDPIWGSLYSVTTAEGPEIICGRLLDGTPRLQVQESNLKPERSDSVAEVFVTECERAFNAR